MRKEKLFVLIAAALLLSSSGAASAEPKKWKALPSLLFQACVNINHTLEPVPYTRNQNDYVFVTAYEERPENTAGELQENARFLDIYLVNGLLINRDRLHRQVFNTHLIVAVTVHNSESETQTVHKWVMSDEDRDGLVDNARFETAVKSAWDVELSSSEVDIPKEDLGSIQTYYKDAINRIGLKVRGDAARLCARI